MIVEGQAELDADIAAGAVVATADAADYFRDVAVLEAVGFGPRFEGVALLRISAGIYGGKLDRKSVV